MDNQIDTQLDAVNSASRTASKAHITLLVFIAYTGITVWSTTHEQLLVGSAVTLPLLNVDVPIESFYAITPWLSLILHINLLLYVMLLSSKLYGFDDTLTCSTHLPERRRQLLRLETFSVTQWLSGHDESMISRATVRIAYIMLIYVLPVAILLSFQFTFLPAHHSGITSIHRWTICADLLCLWLFSWHVQPLRVYRSGSLRWTFKLWQAVARVTFGLIPTFFIVFFSFWIAVAPKIPSWWVEINGDLPPWLNRAVRSVPRALEVSRKTLVAEAPPPEVLAAYHQRGEPIDSAWLQHAQGLDLTKRDFRFADFERSRLWNADLRDSRLDGAVLLGADLRGALFTRREVRGGSAFLDPAELRGADFSQASFPEGDLSAADLVFSDLYKANFPGSDLRKAKLVGAGARFVDLRGAALAGVDAHGADFFGADLRAANLRGANLLAANLSSARLQGADLRGAKLQGVDFRRANLHGADLRDAEVFGTKFDEADLTLADLRGIIFNDSRGAAEALIRELEKYRPYRAAAVDKHQRTLKKIRSWVDEGSKVISLKKVEHRDAIFDPAGLFSLWGKPITPRTYERRLAHALVSLACDDVPIAKGLLWEQDDWSPADSEKLLPRVFPFNKLSVDPILRRRSAALVKGLETRKCHALRELPASILVELKELLKQR